MQRVRAFKQRRENAMGSVLSHQAAAEENMQRLETDASKVIESIDEITEEFSEAELRKIRKDQIDEALLTRFVKDAMTISGFLFESHPLVKKLPPLHQLANTYIFRKSLCMYFLIVKYIGVGGAKNVSQRKIRNDMIDCHVATCATFFDGLLTKDKKLLEIYDIANAIVPRLQKNWSTAR